MKILVPFLIAFTLLAVMLSAQSSASGLSATTTLNDQLKQNGALIHFEHPAVAGAASYKWIWGDGLWHDGTAQDNTIDHAYTRAGTFTVHLVVADAKNKSLLQAEMRVRVNQPVEFNPENQ